MRVGHEVHERRIRLVSDARDDRHLHGCNRPAQGEIIEHVEVQLRPAPTQEHHGVHRSAQGRPSRFVQGSDQGTNGLHPLHRRIQATDIQRIAVGVVAEVGEEIGVAGCPRRPNQDDALGHGPEGQPSVASDGPFPLEGLKGLLPSPLHFSEQDIQIDALDVEGESVDGMERHVGTEHDFPPRLEHLIELGAELLPDDGETAAPDGAPQLGKALAPLLLDQVEVTVLAGETALADFGPHPEEASAGALIEHALDSGRHAAERINRSLGIRGAISGGLGGCRHEGPTYP